MRPRTFGGPSASGAVRKCHILMELLDHVDRLILPLVIDEIGMTGDREALGRLLTIAEGDLPNDAGEFLRVKAIEAWAEFTHQKH